MDIIDFPAIFFLKTYSNLYSSFHLSPMMGVGPDSPKAISTFYSPVRRNGLQQVLSTLILISVSHRPMEEHSGKVASWLSGPAR